MVIVNYWLVRLLNEPITISTSVIRRMLSLSLSIVPLQLYNKDLDRKKNPVFVLGKIDASAIRNAQNTSSSSISNITLGDFFLCSLELHFFLFAFHIFHLARRYFCFFFLFIRFFSSLSFFSVALFSRIVS